MAKPEKTPAAATVAAPAETAVAVMESPAAAVAVAPAPRQFVVKRIVTMPLFKMEVGVTSYLRFDGKIFTGKKIVETNKDGKDISKEAPQMANITDLETGKQFQVMLGAVLQRLLHEEYPNDAYVGMSFAVRLNEQKRGRGAQNYNTYSLAEIEA